MDRRKLKIRPRSTSGMPARKKKSRAGKRNEPFPVAMPDLGPIDCPGGSEAFRIFHDAGSCPLSENSPCLALVFEIMAIPPSLNQLFARGHWRRRKELAEQWHLLVRSAVNARPQQRFYLVVRKVNIWITVYHTGRGGKVFDSDNIVDKLVIDGLKGIIIPDDSPEYVQWTATRSRPGPPDRTVIVVEAVE